ncbi:MAG: hypothetical protein Q7R49_00755 [Candidatus Daviesbacteria bacterium]|nr:hypothetical protein [Candidatus Daviesbacteria bacterium]
MSLIGNLTARLPFGKKLPQAEYFFALNVGSEKLTAALWMIEAGVLKVISTSTQDYSSTEEIINVTDKLLDVVLGDSSQDPAKILFGVPDAWLQDDELKDPYLKLLRDLVKELELSPMAYVATSHALSHFMEKQEGSPITAILVNIGKKNVDLFSFRAGKSDGTATVERGVSLGADIEKGILSGVQSEVLPSKMLIFGDGNLEKQKNELTTYPWMAKLSFLHLPKIEVVAGDVEISAVCLAGAAEISENIKFDFELSQPQKSTPGLHEMDKEKSEELLEDKVAEKPEKEVLEQDLGFIAGDISEATVEKQAASDILDAEVPVEKGMSGDDLDELEGKEKVLPAESVVMSPEREVAWEELEEEPDTRKPLEVTEEVAAVEAGLISKMSGLKNMSLPSGGKKIALIVAAIIIILGIVILFLPHAEVMVYIEPRVLEKDTQVIADPTIKSVDEASQKIPGEIVETQISGNGTGSVTGKKQIGNASKGTVIIINNTNGGINFPVGTVLTSSDGLKFTTDNTASVSATLADDTDKKTVTVNVTAAKIGPDSNIASGVNLAISGHNSSQAIAKTQGNFSGGTSQDVTVVSSDDQAKLLAQVLSDLRSKAVQDLQTKLDGSKKVLPETLNESVVKKTFSKNVNDQATSFTLNLTVRYKGTAFNDTDLKTMVAKLVETTVPDGFVLNIADSETQADVSNIDKDGKVTFTARFKAKLMPKIDTDQIKKQLIGRSPQEAADILKSYENVLGSDIKLTPSFPGPLQRLPIMSQNITIEVGLK